MRPGLLVMSCLAGTCASAGGGTPMTGPGAPRHEELMFELRVETGNRHFAGGDGLTIARVLGDRPRIERDGWYQVQGSWNVGSRDEALIELRCASGKAVGDTRRYVRKGGGTFAATFRLAEVGFLHLSLYSIDGRAIGGVYFGQGDGVYRGEHLPGR